MAKWVLSELDIKTNLKSIIVRNIVVKSWSYKKEGNNLEIGITEDIIVYESKKVEVLNGQFEVLIYMIGWGMLSGEIGNSKKSRYRPFKQRLNRLIKIFRKEEDCLINKWYRLSNRRKKNVQVHGD
jgi:hypothetical protein